MIYDYEVTTGKGEKLSLSEFKGKVVLIVNTATGCGFTPQYDELEALYEGRLNGVFPATVKKAFDAPMVGMGPYNPHPETPLTLSGAP